MIHKPPNRGGTSSGLPILFLGDTHGKHAHIEQIVREIGTCTLVHLGDITPLQPLENEFRWLPPGVEFWWIHGNHDADTEENFDRVLQSAMQARWLHGRVVTIAGVRIAGLGGNFQKSVWWPSLHDKGEPTNRQRFLRSVPRQNRWRGGLPLHRRAAIFPDDFEALRRQRADVLVCHEAPSTHRHGVEAIDELAREMGVKKIFHGHHHVRYQAQLPGGIEVHGVGLCGITDLEGNVLVKGEWDKDRKDRWRPFT